ncbi:MAG: high-potential iron-sulfur protein [Leptospirales bacterium]|nr:high-potential iron-sulfur protein [Leptospirales bacterium]
MSNEKQLSRRDFLVRGATAGVATIGLAGFLAACGKRPEEAAGGGAAAESCNDLSALSDAEKAQRSTMVPSLKYTEQSEVAGQSCGNCQLYKAPAGSGCGGCQLFPGPVASTGHCMSWAPKAG